VQLREPANLRFAMADRKIGVRELADRVVCSPGTISKLANGHQVTTSTRIAEAIERELKVSAGLLFIAPTMYRVSLDDAVRETVPA